MSERDVRIVASYQDLLRVLSASAPYDVIDWEGPAAYRTDRLDLGEVREAYDRAADHPYLRPEPKQAIWYRTKEGVLVLLHKGTVLVDPPDPDAVRAGVRQEKADYEVWLREKLEREAREREENERKWAVEAEKSRVAREKYEAEREGTRSER